MNKVVKNLIDIKVSFCGKDKQGTYSNEWTFKVSKSIADQIEAGDREEFCGYVVNTLMSVAGRKFDSMATRAYITDRRICVVDSYNRGKIYFNDLSYFI